jgi:hypothetical protein
MRGFVRRGRAADEKSIDPRRPTLEAVDDVTVQLFALAEELGGDYDGWETPVIT